MDPKRILAFVLLIISILILISIPIWLFTSTGNTLFGLGQPDLNGPPLTPLTFKPIPRATPQAVLTAQGQPGTVEASEAILMDGQTGTVLYEKNDLDPVPMASTTKIMTALIAIQLGNLDQTVTIGQDAWDEVYQHDGSNAGLAVGDKLQLQDLLYALLLPSGDDAAVAIADAVAGSAENFVNIMNVEAQRLKLYQTHFADVDGLTPTDAQGNAIPDVHYSTAYDLVHLASYAMSIPLFAKIVQQPEYDLPATDTHAPYQWKTTNKLLGKYNGMLGIKTGSTPEAGECLVFAAKRNGQMLYGVVLNSPTDDSRFKDTQTLLDWGFALPVQVPVV